jgi:hypothetical protein
MQYVGLGASGMFHVDRKFKLSGNFYGAKYLPQAFRVNDSVSGVITGSIFGVSAGFDCFPNAKAIDIIFSGGLNVGKMKIIQDHMHFLEYRDNDLHRKNMFICPKAGVMTKFYLSKFCITLNAEIVYDISNSRWKEKLLAVGKPSSAPIAGFNQTGVNFSIALGWNTPMLPLLLPE